MTQRVLTPAQYRYIKRTIIETVLPDLVGRRFLPLDPEVGAGAQEVTRNVLDPGEEEARIIPKAGEYGLITPTTQEVTVYIRKIGQAFLVTDEDLDSSQTTGVGLDRQAIVMAGRKIQEYEDNFIFNGYAPAEETGLIAEALNTVGAAEKWSTTNGDPYEDFNEAVGKIENEGFSPDRAVFNSQDMHLLRNKDPHGNTYLDDIVDVIGFSRENILTSKTVPKGTGLIAATGTDIADLKEVEPITPLPPIRMTNDTSQVNVRERIGKDVYQRGAFCSITNIS